MALSTKPCCGCSVEADYGTSFVEGDGSLVSPYSIAQVDPTFQRPAARVLRSTSQIIPNNNPTAVDFTSVAFDSDSMFDPGNPTRLTIPIDGFYLMGFNGQWAQSSARRETSFRLNGSAELSRQSQFNSFAQNHDYNVPYQWFFQPGDYVEVVLFQTSGGNLSINPPINFFMMYVGKKV